MESTSDAEDDVEALRVAQEELRAQNDELLAARQDIEAEHHRYRDLFEFAPDVYLVTDKRGIIREANQAASALLGVPSHFLVGKPLAVFFEPPSRSQFRAVLNKMPKQGRIENWRFQMYHRTAGRIEFSATVGLVGGPRKTQELRWLLHDVSALVRAEQAVAELNSTLEARVRERTAQLELANAAKDEFLGMISHEIRTPITTILGNSEVLQRSSESLAAGRREQALADIRAEAERLSIMIENLLVLSRLEHGHRLPSEPLLVRHLVTDAAARHARRYPQRRIEIELPKRLPPVMGMEIYVSQVLGNLLGNAEKYTPREGTIVIRAEEEQTEVVTRVLDLGPGVPPDEIDEIFMPFYRSPQTAETISGVGIGLSVCRRLIEAQGGRIWATLREPHGLEVAFTLTIADDLDESPSEAENAMGSASP